MFEWLATKVASSTIGAILNPLVNGVLTAQKQKLEAAGSHEARVAELAKRDRDLDQREAELNASVVIAEQGSWFTRSPRPMIAWVVVIVLAKIFVYDKALGQWTGGHTDALGPELWSVIKTVLVAYFGGRTVEKVADKIAGVFK